MKKINVTIGTVNKIRKYIEKKDGVSFNNIVTTLKLHLYTVKNAVEWMEKEGKVKVTKEYVRDSIGRKIKVMIIKVVKWK